MLEVSHGRFLDLPPREELFSPRHSDGTENGTHDFPQQNVLPITNEATACLKLCESGGYAAGGMENGAECCKSTTIVRNDPVR